MKSSSSPAESEDPDLLALDRQVCFALAVAARNVIALYRPLLAPMGLTHPQYLVMLALCRAGAAEGRGARSSPESGACHSPLLKRLEVNGMVIRDGTGLTSVLSRSP